MKRAALAIVGTIAGLVLLLSFKTHGTAAVTTPTVAISPAASPSTGSTPAPARTKKKSPVKKSAAASKQRRAKKSAAASKQPATTSTVATYTGNAADTQYGPIEVQITVKDGKMTAASAVEYPNQDPRDAQINSFAVPQLNSEATAAGSARIDTVSGASYTSAGYIASLQSALDKASL
jgi:uncharacterized protein with FMN-binding domain